MAYPNLSGVFVLQLSALQEDVLTLPSLQRYIILRPIIQASSKNKDPLANEWKSFKMKSGALAKKLMWPEMQWLTIHL